MSPMPIVHARTAVVEDVEMFYREAGAGRYRVLLCLHELPSSSHMYRALLPRLADRWHVIAPDFPGFGLSSAPDRSTFSYRFETLARLTRVLLGELDVDEYAIYATGASVPIALRIAGEETDRLKGLVIQSGTIHEDGLSGYWDPLRAYCALPSVSGRIELAKAMGRNAIRMMYHEGVLDSSKLDPAAWLSDLAFLDRQDREEIYLDLLTDYRQNVTQFGQYQDWLRETRPPILVVWGQNDVLYPPDAAQLYREQMPYADVEVFETGHFVLEERAEEVLAAVRDFLDGVLSGRSV
jgi:pimeloyl-ACP methyl ester carboxylesterase